MEELLKYAIANGNTTAVCALAALMLAQWAGPPIWRKLIQGRNGSSTMRGQLDKIENLAQQTHDAVIEQGRDLDRAKQDIQNIFTQCAKNHMQPVSPGKDGGK